MQGFPVIFCYILGVKVTDLVSLNLHNLRRHLRKVALYYGIGTDSIGPDQKPGFMFQTIVNHLCLQRNSALYLNRSRASGLISR